MLIIMVGHQRMVVMNVRVCVCVAFTYASFSSKKSFPCLYFSCSLASFIITQAIVRSMLPYMAIHKHSLLSLCLFAVICLFFSLFIRKCRLENHFSSSLIHSTHIQQHCVKEGISKTLARSFGVVWLTKLYGNDNVCCRID